ncbi:CHAT domain-containing protein [Pleurocapsales cyanobacterium LEGE 10410]|nr:CHAT domain-containing protein [Pleurocapsales cyanobacterium LEGE 10410]
MSSNPAAIEEFQEAEIIAQPEAIAEQLSGEAETANATNSQEAPDTTEPEAITEQLSEEVETANTANSQETPDTTESEAITEQLSGEAETANAANSQETPDTTESEVIAEQLSEEVETANTANSQETPDTTESEVIAEQLSEEVETANTADSSETQEEPLQEEVTGETETSEEPLQEEVTGETETSEEPSQEEEVTEETETSEESSQESNTEPDFGQLDRVAYETQFQEAPNDLAIQMQEEFQLTQLIGSSGLQLYGTVPSTEDISRRLAELAEQTGKKPAFINISLQSNQLESFVVLPDATKTAVGENPLVASSNLDKINSDQSPALTVRKTVKNTSRRDLMATATQFRQEVGDVRKLGQTGYIESAQELYKVLIEPIEAELEANNIDILVFSMDTGLRLLPLAALHDGEQFLIEKYATALVPSFGLTDTRYVNLKQRPILAMGASEFEEQAALPTMPIELENIVSNPRQGEAFLNEQFTISNFVTQNSRETPFSVVHLGTHAQFKAGDLNNSYIQFYDNKLKIPQLQQLSNQLGWNTDATPIELLVLSACETALGDEEAELGFAGLAVQAGVKSALASLWYVSDLGTLALMGEFYDQLGNTLVKAEALRQTQLEMLQGNVKVDSRQVNLSNGENLPLPENFPDGTLTLSHPYFWSSFTLIGNWN